VLKILEEAGIRVNYISGTSMGGIIGGLYAIGYSADYIAKIVREINWPDIFTDKVSRRNLSLVEKIDDGKFIWSLPMKNFHIMLPSGAIAGQKIFTLFSHLTWSVHHVEDFSQFIIPFRCIAADIVTGEAVVLKSGFLPEALRATMSIPSAFNPIELDGRLLVDGGLVRNLPASDVKDMGADIVIGVNVGAPPYKKEDLNNLVKILLQTTSFLETESTVKESKLCDILIAPELDEYSMVSFDAVDSLIVRGERAARLLLPQLKALADSINTDIVSARYHIPPKIEELYIKSLEVEGLKDVTKAFTVGKLQIYPGSTITRDELEKAIDRLYGSRYFERVSYRFIPSDKGLHLLIKVVERPADEVRFGIRYDSDFKTAILLNTTIRNFLFRGSKLSLSTRLGDKVSFEGLYFAHTGIKQGIGVKLHVRTDVFDELLYQEGAISSIFNIRYAKLNLLLQTFYSNSFAAGFGLQTELVNFKTKIDVSDYPQSNKTVFLNLTGFLEMDTLDRTVFPRRGIRFYTDIKYILNSFAAGGDQIEDGSYTRLSASYTELLPINSKISLRSNISTGSIIGENVHRIHYFHLGGYTQYREDLFPFIGYHFLEFSEKNFLLANIGFQYERWTGKYIIFRANAAKLTNDYADIFTGGDIKSGASLGFGMDTPIGIFEFAVMGNNRDSGLSSFFNIGYHF
ncbi:patatin-like phospholipase family protein, partial [bacterium]|nr:patatin-like phospholipase family protein [bacterium]